MAAGKSMPFLQPDARDEVEEDPAVIEFHDRPRGVEDGILAELVLEVSDLDPPVPEPGTLRPAGSLRRANRIDGSAGGCEKAILATSRDGNDNHGGLSCAGN